ncbi:MAG: isoprenylcysteine carboxylmethyltransferase family protein [Bradymonadales bacterium]|nr:isoprenylcysteine carboxylmethyltransferase family protein [Bradymonadales bacterium]
MEPMNLWKLTVISLLLMLSGVRLFFRWKTGTLLSRPAVSQEGPLILGVRFAFSLLLFATVFSYLFYSRPIAWSLVDLPPWVRIPSAVLGCCAIGVLVLSHRALGGYFDLNLRIRADHRLVTHGPYRLVRHPIYAAYLLFFLSIAGLSGCWAIALAALLLFGLLMTARLKLEEAQLVERFGQRYQDYLQRTGRFFPRLAGRSHPDP